MNFRIDEDVIFVDNIADGVSRTAIRQAFRDFLSAHSGDEWQAEDAANKVRIEKAWWSDSYHGFTHNCAAHVQDGLARNPEFCYPDAKEVTVILDAPLFATETVRGAMSLA